MDAEVWKLLSAGDAGLASRWRSIRASVRPGDADGPDAPLTLGQIERLRASHGAAMARFASLQDEMGRRARKRFPEGRPLFWTSKGLEQATPAAVAEYRARRFAGVASTGSETEGAVVWDACCGVGSDAVAILLALEAERGGSVVIATDWDADSARCAAANLRAAIDEGAETAGEAGDAPHLVARCDLQRPPLTEAALAATLVLLDPDRRPDGEHREPRPERWAPPLSRTLQLARCARGSCIKLPPSLDATAEGLDRGGNTPWQLEWISLDGEMKELALWTGALAGAAGWASGRRTATALRSTSTARLAPEIAQFGSDAAPCALPEAWSLDELRPGTWLVELDPTLWQSDLAGLFCSEHGLAPIETEIRGMFLVAASPPTSPLVRSWPILECMSADRKRVRKALREHGIGPITVKKRNHPKTSLELEAAFQGSGEREGLLAVFRVPGGSLALLLGPPRH